MNGERELPYWMRRPRTLLAVIGAVTTMVTALASVGTVGAAYYSERLKLRAQEESLKAKHASESEDRRDKNAAAERDLRTKYVDLALQLRLGIEQRARIYGYLATVMESPAQLAWAKSEARKAEAQRQQWLQLRTERDDAIAAATTKIKNYMQALGPREKWTTYAIKGLDAMKQTEDQRVANLDARIRNLEEGSSGPASEAEKSTTAATKPSRP